MARALWLLLALVVPSACGAAARESIVAPSETAPPEAATSETAPSVAPEATVDPCAGQEGLAVASLEVPSRWDGGALVVGGRAPLVVRWCGHGIATIQRIEVEDDASGRTLYELDPEWAHLTYGESITRVVTGRAAPGTQTVRVMGEVDGAPIEARARLSSVDAPELAAARAECAAANGTFGPVGMAQSLGCTRPTHDAGQRCLSSADCEGLCLADGFEDASSAPDGRDCPEGSTLRVHVGHCDAIVPHFGCLAELREAESACFGPHALRARASVVCHD
ncbi:MAG: hypothetical protein U0234_31880 [Sandaracinus sp.]